MASATNRGRRLLVNTIDSIATNEPSRPWISVPRDDNDLSQGFVDITYRQFANAINYAASWLESSLGRPSESFEPFAYEGPKDARLPILCVAAVKTGRKILLPFPFMPPRFKGYLIDTTRCTAFLYAQESRESAQSILAERQHMKGLAVPNLAEWMRDIAAKPHEYNKTFSDSKDDPWIIFHTSGTTGLPKPIIYTNQMMTSIDISQSMPDADDETQFSCHVNRRVYSTVPMNHLVGMTAALQSTVWLGTTLVLGPALQPATPAVISQVMTFGGTEGFVSPPFLLRELCRQPSTRQLLKTMKFVQWTGAPLDQETGNAICNYTRLAPAMGTTESGPYWTRMCASPEDWNYYRFREGQGFEMVPRSEKLFELVFRRDPKAAWQQVFVLFPDMEEYATKDLFVKHLTKDGLWLYAGRIDDIVILANGENLHATDVEAIIEQDPAVEAAFLGGNGRNRPFLLLQLTNTAKSRNPSTLSNIILAAIEKVNTKHAELAGLSKELTIVTSSEKPILKSEKGSVLRMATVKQYEQEIEELYSTIDPGVVKME